jgi:hypothetical protein
LLSYVDLSPLGAPARGSRSISAMWAARDEVAALESGLARLETRMSMRQQLGAGAQTPRLVADEPVLLHAANRKVERA